MILTLKLRDDNSEAHTVRSAVPDGTPEIVAIWNAVRHLSNQGKPFMAFDSSKDVLEIQADFVAEPFLIVETPDRITVRERPVEETPAPGRKRKAKEVARPPVV